jgi:hypothetical protein
MIEIRQEPDRVPRRPLVESAIAIVVAIVACAGVTILLTGRQLGLARRVLDRGPDQIESTVFAFETPAEQARRAATDRLRSWGWVDRKAGLIHVPLDVAIELYLAERRSQP